MLGAARSASPAARPAFLPRFRATRRCRLRRARHSTSCRPTAPRSAASNSTAMRRWSRSSCSAKGYAPAARRSRGDMLVRLDYGVDEGATAKSSRDRLLPARYGDPFFGGFYGRPYYSAVSAALLSRFGYYGRCSPFYYGWDDPFWYGSTATDPQPTRSTRAISTSTSSARPTSAAVRGPCQGALADRRARRAGAEPGRGDVHRLPRPSAKRSRSRSRRRQARELGRAVSERGQMEGPAGATPGGPFSSARLGRREEL